MQNRTITNLILENEDLIVCGDLTLTGAVYVKNSNIIVSGQLLITEDDFDIEIEGGDILADSIVFERRAYIIDGDIYANSYLNIRNIVSDGNIEVKELIAARDIKCMDLVVKGKNISSSIEARNIYIEGKNHSGNLIASSDIYLGSNSELMGHYIIAKGSFLSVGEVVDCRSISVN